MIDYRRCNITNCVIGNNVEIGEKSVVKESTIGAFYVVEKQAEIKGDTLVKEKELELQ